MIKTELIEESFYKKIIENIPILTVDLILLDKNSKKFILVRRADEPLKGELMTPGGRVFKNERIMEAASRKCLEELGLTVNSIEWQFVGFFEGSFNKSCFDLDCNTHTVSLILSSRILVDSSKIKLDSHSSEWVLSDSLPSHLLSTGYLLPILNNLDNLRNG